MPVAVAFPFDAAGVVEMDAIAAFELLPVEIGAALGPLSVEIGVDVDAVSGTRNGVF